MIATLLHPLNRAWLVQFLALAVCAHAIFASLHDRTGALVYLAAAVAFAIAAGIRFIAAARDAEARERWIGPLEIVAILLIVINVTVLQAR